MPEHNAIYAVKSPDDHRHVRLFEINQNVGLWEITLTVAKNHKLRLTKKQWLIASVDDIRAYTGRAIVDMH